MTPLQTRIFVPWADPYTMEQWIETIAGRILQPLIQKHQISYFWFTRYLEGHSGSNVDTDLSAAPQGYRHPNQDAYRSLRFRFWIGDQDQKTIDADLKSLVVSADCWISDLRGYDDLNDLANNRFCGEPYSDQRREERRDLMRDFLCSSSKLFFHMLQGPDPKGSYSLERNIDRGQNPEENTFQSIHHLFCNLTDVPLKAYVKMPISVGSYIYPPNEVSVIHPMKIQF